MSHSLADIKEALSSADNILIIAHTQPDGDTLGSCFALYCTLTGLGKKAEICCDSPMPDKYEPLFETGILKMPEDIGENYDIIAALDCADKSRLGKAIKVFKHHDNTVNIDHHITNDEYAKLNYVREASSVGELIFELLQLFDIEITEKIAEYIYIAISTDTGNFTYSNTSKTCMSYASQIIEKFDISVTADMLFRRRSLKSTQLIGRGISSLEMHADGKVSIMTITLKDLEELDAQGSDCENIVNYAREIDTVKAAVVLRELHTGVKVSLRSKGDVDVGAIASAFNGGGHKNASGCCIGGGLDEAKQKVLDSLLEIV